jgi:hypothetical protein
VTFVIGCVHLKLESIRVIDLERFLCSGIRCSGAAPSASRARHRIEVGDSEIEVIDGGIVPPGLLKAKKGISDTENNAVADCCLSGIPKNS